MTNKVCLNIKELELLNKILDHHNKYYDKTTKEDVLEGAKNLVKIQEYMINELDINKTYELKSKKEIESRININK